MIGVRGFVVGVAFGAVATWLVVGLLSVASAEEQGAKAPAESLNIGSRGPSIRRRTRSVWLYRGQDQVATHLRLGQATRSTST